MTESIDESADALLAQWRQGDQQAADKLFRRYADRLIALAQSRMPARLNQRIDAEDVVQSVYRSFFNRTRAGQYEAQYGGDVWRLLVTITLHKLTNEVAHHKAAKRAMDRELPLATSEDNSLPGVSPEVLAREPSPMEAVVLAEELEQVMAALTPVQRQILELRLQGYKIDEIADQVHRSQRTVRRVLDNVKANLGQQQTGDGLP